MSATHTITVGTGESARQIGPDHEPFVIAEMSGNHNQSLERALAIVEAAAKAGAHGLKLQTYTADTMTLDVSEGDFFISDPQSRPPAVAEPAALRPLRGGAHPLGVA